jgi:hypothetical protein
MNEVSSELLRENGNISFVDILFRMEELTKKQYEHWRFHRVSCLERVVMINLPRLNLMLRILRQNAKKGGLRPGKTVYVSWGKTGKDSVEIQQIRGPEYRRGVLDTFPQTKKGVRKHRAEHRPKVVSVHAQVRRRMTPDYIRMRVFIWICP